MRTLIGLLIVLSFSAAGCTENSGGGPNVDKAGIGRYVWKNKSDHAITLSVFGKFENKELPVGEAITEEMSGFTVVPGLDTYVRRGMSIVFDEGPYGGVFNSTAAPSTNPKPDLQNPENYAFELYEETDPAVYYSAIGTWTYTFTNADYDAAVARGPMEATEQNE